jgi:hypothetical protein
MLKYRGDTFYRLSQLLSVITTMHEGTLEGVKMTFAAFGEKLPPVNLGIDVFAGAKIPDAYREGLKPAFENYRPHLEAAGLRISLKSFDRIVALLDQPDVLLSKFSERANDLQSRIQDELEEAEFWQIAPQHRKFMERDPFKLVEGNKLPSAHRDIEEAGKSLAFDRATACVFHLMRVMECGLRKLGESLNNPELDPRRNPNWERILGKCDDELKKTTQDRSPEWRTDDLFFSTATANLRAVKDAWRNPSLHVERDYTPEEAEEVWNAVRAFVRHLTQKLG